MTIFANVPSLPAAPRRTASMQLNQTRNISRLMTEMNRTLPAPRQLVQPSRTENRRTVTKKTQKGH